MTDNQIIEETLRYLSDNSYQYAILIDGEWGCGKTYFVQHTLREQIEKKENEYENPRKFKYVSLYGCKNIQDIQENIIWGFADEVKEKCVNKAKDAATVTKVGDNILLSTRKIANALQKIFAPNLDAYDLASDWFTMKSYIFVFDDIERCDCPLNEVFGYINGLVEHEGTKVILIANEKEIAVHETISQKELQYSLVLNDKIEWPPKEDRYSFKRNNVSNGKVSIDILEERRRILFDDDEIDEEYCKIREKLIGVTLYYQPDVKGITVKIIENSVTPDYLKDQLLEHIEIFYEIMEMYNHHNLRTFQFFLSKLQYLYSKFVNIGVEVYYQEQALSFLIQDCFMWAVQFKGNIPVPIDGWERAKYEARRKSAAIKAYVEIGEFNQYAFQEDILKYVDQEVKNKLSPDDPLSLLCYQYYYHTQRWCEERLEEIKQNLQDNKYPLFEYEKLIIILVRLTNIGFSESYKIEMKNIMLNNIPHIVNPVKLDNDIFYIEDPKVKQEVRDFVDEINMAIITQDKQIKHKNITEILLEDKWVEGLNRYTESDSYKRSMDCSVFAKADSNKWIQKIMAASVEDIYNFRRWLDSNYLLKGIREDKKVDLPFIEKIMEGLKPEIVDDLIKRTNLIWLKEQMKSILNSYS